MLRVKFEPRSDAEQHQLHLINKMQTVKMSFQTPTFEFAEPDIVRPYAVVYVPVKGGRELERIPLGIVKAPPEPVKPPQTPTLVNRSIIDTRYRWAQRWHRFTNYILRRKN